MRAHGLRGQAIVLTARKGRLFWEYLLLAFGDMKGVTTQTRRRIGRQLFVPFFPFFFSPCRSGSNFFLLVLTSVLDRSADQPPPFSFKALSLIQTDSPSAGDPPVDLFFFFYFFLKLCSSRVLFVYMKFGGSRIAFVRRLSSDFFIPGSLITPCARDLFQYHCA